MEVFHYMKNTVFPLIGRSPAGFNQTRVNLNNGPTNKTANRTLPDCSGDGYAPHSSKVLP